MTWVPVLLAVAFVVGVVVASLLWKRDISNPRANLPERAEEYPYRKTPSLLSTYELELYHGLLIAMGQNVRIFAKVRLYSLVTLPRRTDRAHFYRNLAASKHVDFVVCEGAKTIPVLAVLVVSSKRKEDVSLVAGILKSIRLPVLTVQHGHSMSPADLRANVRQALQKQVDEKPDDLIVESHAT